MPRTPKTKLKPEPAIEKVVSLKVLRRETLGKQLVKPTVLAEPVVPQEAADSDDYTPPEERFDEKAEAGAKEKYYPAVGRRKESVARVRLSTRKSTDELKNDKALLTVNGKDYQDYFQDSALIAQVETPFRKLKSLNRFKASVIVRGGGLAGQARAVVHGLARTLEKFDGNFRKKLKKSNLLTRDPRVKERRKYGHKKARKMGRWSKR